MPNCSDDHHGRRPYPLCLARPDLAGRIRTRSRKTSDDYDTRYTYLAVSTARALGREPSIFDVASHVRSRAPEIRYGSYRNYKAAVLHHARVLWNRSEMTEEDVEEVARTLFVPGNDQGETLPFIPRGEGPVRCGHRRAKTITEAARDTLVQRAESLASRTGEQLRLILRLGPHCGLRPTEWTTAELCG
ncbi:hypothetical protein VQ042_25590 [Aurantimonas sp. A2-1-M11]|uniref:hypothetical protein n=1 Tax=Aurantimonas sp. A2-1-M11 TaxID=3113712 RepID=UPI002F956954